MLSRESRVQTIPDLRRCRWVLDLSLLCTVAGKIVALFQVGLIRRLPDPPVGLFDSKCVNASDTPTAGWKRPTPR